MLIANLIRDEHGYISNVGASKYLGVTFTTDPNTSVQKWIVCVTDHSDTRRPDGVKKSLNFLPQNFELTEFEAAAIAAKLYDVKATQKTAIDIDIGQNSFRVTPNRKIYKYPRNEAPELTLVSNSEPSEPVVKTDDEVAFIEKYVALNDTINGMKFANDDEKALIKKLSGMIYNDTLTPHVAAMLSKVLKQVK